MTLKNELQLQGDLRARRFAKGRHCEIITGPLLRFCTQYLLAPEHFNPDPKTGYDPYSGLMLLLPKEHVETAEELRLQAFGSPVAEDIRSGAASGARFLAADPAGRQVQPSRGAVEALMKLMRQVLIVSRVPVGASIDPGAAPSARKCEVIVEGTEVMQEATVRFVAKSVEEIQDGDENNKTKRRFGV